MVEITSNIPQETLDVLKSEYGERLSNEECVKRAVLDVLEVRCDDQDE